MKGEFEFTQYVYFDIFVQFHETLNRIQMLADKYVYNIYNCELQSFYVIRLKELSISLPLILHVKS